MTTDYILSEPTTCTEMNGNDQGHESEHLHCMTTKCSMSYLQKKYCGDIFSCLMC